MIQRHRTRLSRLPKQEHINNMEEELKKIREHIKRAVTHIAREHQVMDKVVWEQMLLAAMEHSDATAVKLC